MEPVIKIDSIPFLNSEEALAEVKAPMDAIAESELLPTFTKEDVPIDIKFPTAISMEDSFQPPTIHDKKYLKNDTLPLAISEPDIEIKAEEIEIPKDKNAEKKTVVEDLINNKLTTKLEANDKTVNSVDEEKTLVVPKIEKEEQEAISNHIEKNDEKEKDVPTEIKIKEITVENEKVNKVLPVTEIEESEFVERVAEKSEEISLLEETKISDIKEMIPRIKIIRTDEIVEVPLISEKVEVEQEKKISVVDVEEVKKIMPETISPTVDITEVEKFKPDKFPIDVEKTPITKAIEEKIKIEEPTLILNEKEDSLFLDATIKEKIENEKPAIKKEEVDTAESLLIAEIAKKEQNKVTELSPIEAMEKKEKNEAVKLPPISDIVREKKIEAAEVSPITDIMKTEQIEAAELLPNMIKKEKIEAEELLPHADVVTEGEIKIIQPMSTLPTIKKEMEEELEDLEKMLKVEIKKEKDEEIKEVPLPEEVIPSIELSEKKEEEEMPQVKKEEIPTTAPLLKKPTSKIKKEVSEEKKPEMVQIELKIPIAEIKSTEMEVPAIPFDPRLVAQPYLIIAKIKEKELLQIISAKPPCTECCLVSKYYSLQLSLS